LAAIPKVRSLVGFQRQSKSSPTVVHSTESKAANFSKQKAAANSSNQEGAANVSQAGHFSKKQQRQQRDHRQRQ